jgi:hypothetical protein
MLLSARTSLNGLRTRRFRLGEPIPLEARPPYPPRAAPEAAYSTPLLGLR